MGERQENSNEEATVHSLRTCRNKRTACQEATEANLEKMEPVDRTITILEKMEATNLKANTEVLESESERLEASKEDSKCSSENSDYPVTYCLEQLQTRNDSQPIMPQI